MDLGPNHKIGSLVIGCSYAHWSCYLYSYSVWSNYAPGYDHVCLTWLHFILQFGI